jgi:PhzF family phenazine biosynthesis protein
MDAKIVNVFSINNKGGNPCAIVDNANNLTTKEMQRKATLLDFPESIFIIHNKNQYILRFFATKNELPLCCHGVLGAAFYLYKSNCLQPIYIQAYHNQNKINVECSGDLMTMFIKNNGIIVDSSLDFPTISKLLDIDHIAIDKQLPCAIASIGSPKLLIPIINREILFDMAPKLDLITQWCKNHRVNGIYAYSKDTENTNSSYVGRSFNPLFSHQEDIATGVAAAALCLLISKSKGELESNYIIEQGSNLHKPSKIYISIKEKNIKIKGEAYFSN